MYCKRNFSHKRYINVVVDFSKPATEKEKAKVQNSSLSGVVRQTKMDQPDVQTVPSSHGETTLSTHVLGDASDTTCLPLPVDLSKVEGQETEDEKNSENSSLQVVVEVGNGKRARSNIMNYADDGGNSTQCEDVSLSSNSYQLPAQTCIPLPMADNENKFAAVPPHIISVNESTVPGSQNEQEKSGTSHTSRTENSMESEFQYEYHSHDHSVENKDPGLPHSHSKNYMTDVEHAGISGELGSSITEKTMVADESLNYPSDGNRQHDIMQELPQVSTYPICEVPDKDLENFSSLKPALKTADSRYVLSPNSVMECLTTASACFQERFDDNFLKGCKWSPDGNQIMTNSNDNYLRIFTPEKQLAQGNKSMDPTCVIREKSQVYDFCWCPSMSSSIPDSCRVACTCSGIPIHMWDSNDGTIVSHYLAYDHCDEITAAYSLSFSPDGSKLFAGYKKSIRIFDTERPGRTCRLLKTYNSMTKEGVTGIISCFAFSQDASPIFVTGSYSRHVGVYDYASQQLIYMMHGQQGGVTHVALSPDGTKLYTGGRKDPEIVCWDMRKTGQVLFTCLRDVQTNQRIFFDLSESGQYLVSGNHDGSVLMWNTLDAGENINGEVIIKPCFSFCAHQDCVNGVSFNHQHNILATSSGQRHFMDFEDYDSDSSSMSVENTGNTVDYSLKLWKIPTCSANISA